MENKPTEHIVEVFASGYLQVPVIDEIDREVVLMAPKPEALAAGFSDDGEYPNDIDEEVLDGIMSRAIDPELN